MQVMTSRRPKRSAQENRALVLGAAAELFYAEGIHAVGIDRVAEHAGVAPTTIYRAFESKDELVTAYVTHRDEAWRAWFSEIVSEHDDPIEAIIAVFEGAEQQIGSDHYRGCPFLMALAEYPDRSSGPHRAAVANKRWAHDQFRKLLRVDDRAPVAAHLLALLDGVYTSAQALGPDGPAQDISSSLRQLLDNLEVQSINAR